MCVGMVSAPALNPNMQEEKVHPLPENVQGTKSAGGSKFASKCEQSLERDK